MVIPKLVNKMNFDSTVRGMVVVGQELYVIADRICDVLIFDADTHQSEIENTPRRITSLEYHCNRQYTVY